MKPNPEDIRIGKMAALENVSAAIEHDIGKFRRDDLTAAQNDAMQEHLTALWMEFNQRRRHLRIYAGRCAN